MDTAKSSAVSLMIGRAGRCNRPAFAISGQVLLGANADVLNPHRHRLNAAERARTLAVDRDAPVAVGPHARVIR